MKYQLYCVVDAGGNPYEFSFHKNKGGAQYKFIMKDIPGHGQILLSELDRRWLERRENGDRLVLCDIETNEEIKINVRD